MKPQMIEEKRERATLNPKPNNNIIYIIGCRVDEILSASSLLPKMILVFAWSTNVDLLYRG
jgi:hypothetical protein